MSERKTVKDDVLEWEACEIAELQRLLAKYKAQMP